MSHGKQQKKSPPLTTELSKSPPMGEQRGILGIATASGAFPTLESLYLASEMGELKEKLKGTSDENAKLKEKLTSFKKNNASLSTKVNALESLNQKQKDTIRALEIAQEKLQKDLETVRKAKDKLRIEVEEKISKFSKENEILTERLEALTKEFEAVESENKDLKRSLEDLTSDNCSLKEKVSLVQQENEKLKDDMAKLHREHEEIKEKLECKETRLALGQVAWLLEAEIWKNVLPNKTMGKTRILHSMERWLSKNSANEEGKAAKKRWDALKENLAWDDEEHKSALKVLKDLRAEDAHPVDVNLEEAKIQLNEGDYVGDVDKKSCQEIIEMIVKARAINAANLLLFTPSNNF